MSKSVLARLCPALILITLIGCATGTAGPEEPKTEGKKKHTNLLAKETSPYLLMHAHNPVNWYPWGPEAFAKAKKEGKMVFLSIGYSSCYWCHVMERESFENKKVADLLNKWFVCIKVDREERPDVDQIYMTALTDVITGRGGWPMSMFLTPDGRPFYGGTYFPRASFVEIVKKVHEIQVKDPKKIEKFATAIAKATKEALETPPVKVVLFELNRKLVSTTLESLDVFFDPVYGGFGHPARKFQGSKFPSPTKLELMLHEAVRTKNKKLLGQVTLTLDKMARGGMYDQLGGGFHRYSTERTWTVPHFEKMLYDNAQLAEVYAKAYRVTKKPLYKRILQETLDYVIRDMMSPKGRFYSSQDAETHEEEGRYYVWTDKELQQALPNKKDLQFVKQVYGIGAEPNFEKKYHILTLPQPLDQAAKKLGMSDEKFEQRLDGLKSKLLQIRRQREKPFLNKIALTAWSGLMIAGFAEAGHVLKQPKYIDTAKKAANFLLAHQKTKDGRLWRTYGAAPGKKPKAAVAGYLQDYACLVHGLLTLYDATGEKRWLKESLAINKAMMQHHGDKSAGGFYFTSHDHEKFFARSKDQFDGAIPSGNSIAMRNLVRLWKTTGEKSYITEAEKGFKSFALTMKQNPQALTTMMHGLSLYLDQQDKTGKGTSKKKTKSPVNLLGGNKFGKTPQPVEIKATASKIDARGRQTITVTVAIDKGWHLYANPVKNDMFTLAQTRINITGKSPPKTVKINYPKGHVVKDKTAGTYHSYEGKVVITAEVQHGKERGPLNVRVFYQACDANRCLAPRNVAVSIAK